MLLIKSYRHVGVPPPVYPGGSAQRVENLGGERACYDVRGDDRNSGGGAPAAPPLGPAKSRAPRTSPVPEEHASHRRAHGDGCRGIGAEVFNPASFLAASSSLAASSASTVSFRASAASLVALRRSCARVATSSAAPPSPSALVPRALRPPSPLSPRPRPRPHPDHCTPQKNALRGAQGRFAPSSKDFSLRFCRTRKPQTHEEEPRGSAAATPAGREGGARPQVVRSRRHWCVWGSGWGAGDTFVI